MLSSWQIQSSIFNHNSYISRWTDLSCFLWSFFKYVILFLRQVWTTFIIQNHPAILKLLKNNVYSLPCFPISFKQGFYSSTLSYLYIRIASPPLRIVIYLIYCDILTSVWSEFKCWFLPLIWMSKHALLLSPEFTNCISHHWVMVSLTWSLWGTSSYSNVHILPSLCEI